MLRSFDVADDVVTWYCRHLPDVAVALGDCTIGYGERFQRPYSRHPLHVFHGS